MNREVVEKLIDELEAEVNNGGFHQFFFNSAGDRTAETIHALNLIGATRTAAIVSQAAARFPGAMPLADRDERQGQLESISPDGDEFEDLDEAFLAYEDDLAILTGSYVSRGA